jgi:hypothetical protein
MFRGRTLLSENHRSYATEGTLIKKLTSFGFDDFPHVRARTREGRWTAIFYGEESNPVIFQQFLWVM